jgi:hypothetical protein
MDEAEVQKRKQAVTDRLASVSKEQQSKPVGARWGALLLAKAVERLGEAWATDADGAFVRELGETAHLPCHPERNERRT